MKLGWIGKSQRSVSTSRSSTGKTTQRRSRSVNQDNWGSVWRVFIIVFLLSVLLTIFILFRQRQWRGQEQRSVIVAHLPEQENQVRQKLSVILFRPGEEIHVLQIPARLKIETPLEYGIYESDALVGLTQLEDLKWDYLRYSISLELGVAIDDVVWTSQSEITKINQLRRLAFWAFLNQRDSTMSLWDRGKMWWWSVRLPSYQLESTDLSKYLTSTDELNEDSYDRWAQLYLQDSQIRASDFSVVVRNGSGINNYASRVARFLTLTGYYVRSVETVDQQEDQEETALFLQSRPDSWPAWRLLSLVDEFPWYKDKQLTQDNRAQAVWVIGTNERQLFSQNKN